MSVNRVRKSHRGPEILAGAGVGVIAVLVVVSILLSLGLTAAVIWAIFKIVPAIVAAL